MAHWEEMVNEHGRLVWHIANRLLGNEHDAADCYQNVFIEAFDVSRRKTIANWPGFMTQLTTRRAIDQLRQRFRQPDSKTDELLVLAGALSDSPVRRAEVNELVEQLQRAITRLPPEQADVFCLRCFEQLSYQQIAERLALGPNHVGVLLHRARENLKAAIADADEIAD